MKKIYSGLLVLGMAASAQQGVVDNSFNAPDNDVYKQIVFNQFGDLSYIGSTPVLLPNGKIVIISPWDATVYRYNADGSLDSTFQSPSFGVNENYITYDTLFLQPDGKLLLVYSTEGNMMRLNSNGTIDTSFTSPVFSGPGYITDVEFQTDGKILVTGDFVTVNNSPQTRFTRLNANGSVDTTFDMGLGFSNVTTSVEIQPDGKILVVGLFLSYNTSTIDHIVRINTNGSVDTSFTLTSGSYFYPDGAAYDVKVLPNGKIVVSGTEDLYRYNNQTKKGIVCLNSNGAYDTTFNAQSFLNTFTFGGIEEKIAVQPDGKIILEKGDNNLNNYYRLNTNGSKDTGFVSSSVNDGFITRFIVQPDGKIIVGGSYNNPATGITRNTLHRVNANGSLDLSFMPNMGTNHRIFRSFVQQDNKVLLIGQFTSYNDQYAPHMARIDLNGNLDTSFTLDTSVKVPFSYSQPYPVMKEQEDGKILIAGGAYTVNNVTKSIIRINTNGSLDTGFNAQLGIVNDFEVLPDGKIIVAGRSDSFLTNGNYKLLRLNANGTVDTTYPAYTFNIAPITLELLPDGKMLVGGEFNNYNGSSAYALIRLNADGTRDNSFSYEPLPVTGNTYANRTLTQPDGKILVAFINTFIGSSSIARLNADGSVDTSFTINNGSATSGAGGDVGYDNMILLPDGKILVKGYANNFNGQPSPNLILLNADGTLDSSFDVPDSGSSRFYSLAGCDRLIATGKFTTIGTAPRNNIAAINASTGPISPTGDITQYFNAGNTLADLDVTGQGILWYANPSECDDANTIQYVAKSAQDTNIDVPLPLSTQLVNGVTYYASQTVNNDESKFRLPVKALLGTPAATPENNITKLVVYPNPTSGLLSIDAEQPFQEVTVYNSVGLKVMELKANEMHTDIDLSSYSAGIYIVRVTSGSIVNTFKVAKK